MLELPPSFLEIFPLEAPALGKAAAWYAEKKWPVFPLRPRDKIPLTSHGVHDATTNPATIAGWWKAEPNANIAIAMGAPAGLFALDIDGEAGAATLAALERYHGPLPVTVEAVTPRGRHLVFRLPPNVVVRNSAGKIGPGIDVRGTGGYIVAPPSVHPCGTRYQFKA